MNCQRVTGPLHIQQKSNVPLSRLTGSRTVFLRSPDSREQSYFYNHTRSKIGQQQKRCVLLR